MRSRCISLQATTSQRPDVKVGISDGTYYNWRKKFGGASRSQLAEKKALEKENKRLKRIVAELELDKLILKESLDFLKPKA